MGRAARPPAARPGWRYQHAIEKQEQAMQCQNWQKLILLEASGELGSWRRRHLERHLQACGDCRGFQRNLAEISRLHQPAAAQPAPATIAGMRAMIRAHRPAAAPARAAVFWRPHRLQAAAILAVLLAGAGWLLLHGYRPATPAPPGLAAATADDDPLLETILTENVVEIRRAHELTGTVSPLELELMLLEGLLI